MHRAGRGAGGVVHLRESDHPFGTDTAIPAEHWAALLAAVNTGGSATERPGRVGGEPAGVAASPRLPYVAGSPDRRAMFPRANKRTAKVTTVTDPGI
jgi:hypothetical protein